MIIPCTLAFFIGSIPTAYLIGKWLKGVDIRQFGSGNVGATNAFRVFGKKIGALVFVLDFLKGCLPTFFFIGQFHQDVIPALIVGLCAVAGHVFTPFLGFKGGKGIATGGGVLAATFPLLFLIAGGAWILSFMLWRVVAISSILAVLTMALTVQMSPYSIGLKNLFWVLFIFVVWTHRSNIKKLLVERKQAKINRTNN